LKLHSLQIDHVVQADAVTLSVSLNYGLPNQHLVPVATVTLRNGQSAWIEGLTQYGVDSITVSIGEPAPVSVVQPAASSVSPLVDMAVEVTGPDLPIYKVTLRNRGQIGIAALNYGAYRDGKIVLSGRKKTNRNTTVLAPGAALEFTVQTTPEARGVMDRFEVTAVLWDDGTVEGDPGLKASEESLTEGFVRQLRRVLEVLSDAKTTTIDALRATLERLPIDSDARGSSPIGQQIVKTAVLDDLNEYAQGRSDNANSSALAWIDAARVRYSEWLRRASK
jgi:hypothetical protein